jgi:hypothetical protein
MTVRREFDDHLELSPADAAVCVRRILERPPYIHSQETISDAAFKSVVKPSWILLGTDLIIQLAPHGTGTQVSAATVSQWYVTGDIFNCYNRYLTNFFDRLRTEAEKLKLDSDS